MTHLTVAQSAAARVSFTEFVQTHWPGTETPLPYHEEISELVEAMAAVGISVSEDAVRRIITVPDVGPVFNPSEIRRMIESAGSRERATPEPPKKTSARKRWETLAAYAKRMRKQR